MARREREGKQSRAPSRRTSSDPSSPAGRPYDLRPTCITTWLNAWVPGAEAARRVGASPEVIHRVHERCIYGQEAAMNKKIEQELDWLRRESARGSASEA